MAKKITRNEYYKLIQEKGRVFKDGEYEILPLDLSEYSLYRITQDVVNRNFIKETTDMVGEYMLTGHWLKNHCHVFADKCSFKLHQVDGLSAYAYSDEQLALFVYCEGDIFLTLFKDKEKYRIQKEETIKFYKEKY